MSTEPITPASDTVTPTAPAAVDPTPIADVPADTQPETSAPTEASAEGMESPEAEPKKKTATSPSISRRTVSHSSPSAPANSTGSRGFRRGVPASGVREQRGTRPATGAGVGGFKTNNEGPLTTITGFIDLTVDGHAVVRKGFSQSRNDAYLSIAMIRRLGIRPGDVVEATAREPRENDRYWGVKDILSVNGKPLSEARNRRRFEDLVPVYPKEKLVLEIGKEPVGNRLIDLVAPIGKGQRGLIVSPPKAGKTTVMKEISTGIATNYPDVHLMAVLIGERPEEVTDISRHISAITAGKGETAASNFDEPAIEQTRVAEVALERAKRLVENGQHVVILMDSITRLARAYNLAIPTSGRTLSGGFDPAALYPPKRFFGAARNFEEGGSLTIIATALVDTGSRMDDLVYEEFKGTGNMELHLDRRIAERRIFPAINLQRSGTRRDDLLFTPDEYQSVVMMHRMIDMLGEDDRTSMVVRRLKETNTNKQFLASLKEG